MKKVYTRLSKITKATITLLAEGVGNEEMAIVDGRRAQVVKISGNEVTLQVFSGTDGLATNSRVHFLGVPPQLTVGARPCRALPQCIRRAD
jgi:V/A-type H+-transporting ATPase subunit B